MKDHLKADQVDRYRHRSLAPGELLALDDHLAGCEECRGRLLDGIRLKHPALPDCVTHLTYEQVAAYIDHDIDDIDVEILHSHVELCRQCEEEVRNLDQFRRDFSRSPIPQPAPKARSFLGDSVRRRLRLGVLIPAAAAVTVAALAVIVLWPNRRPERVLLALNDGGGRITLTASGTVRGVEGLPKAYRDPIREALQSQQFQPSAELSSLISRGGVLRGSGRGESFPLLTPNATMVETAPVRLDFGIANTAGYSSRLAGHGPQARP
jgi:hypothetical protein